MARCDASGNGGGRVVDEHEARVLNGARSYTGLRGVVLAGLAVY